ncbi:major facilitator superfamily protein [Klebsiella variicola]|nr:major facilitator superfamily protein [Klebsiella variicola]
MYACKTFSQNLRCRCRLSADAGNGCVLVGFIIIGVALPVLPLHVKNDLGFGTFIVGLVAGAQFAASLISRVWSGSYSDRRGAKKGVVVGLIAAVVSGLLYQVSLWLVSIPVVSVSVLLAGRAILGGAESFVITGAVAWGLALVDKEHAGKVIAWVGTAMFAAMALGGPVGRCYLMLSALRHRTADVPASATGTGVSRPYARRAASSPCRTSILWLRHARGLVTRPGRSTGEHGLLRHPGLQLTVLQHHETGSPSGWHSPPLASR